MPASSNDSRSRTQWSSNRLSAYLFGRITKRTRVTFRILALRAQPTMPGARKRDRVSIFMAKELTPAKGVSRSLLYRVAAAATTSYMFCPVAARAATHLVSGATTLQHGPAAVDMRRQDCRSHAPLSGLPGGSLRSGWSRRGLLFLRGGAWFTGYSDTTEDESEGYTSEEETSDAEDVSDGDAAYDEEDTESDTTVSSARRRTPGELPSLSRAEVLGFDELNETIESMTAVAGRQSCDTETAPLAKEADGAVDTNDAQRNASKEKQQSGKDLADETGAVPALDTDAQGIYASTVARRRMVSAIFRVLQKALLRTAFLLVAFQVLPWLKHNVVAQWLLLGSLILQTASEIGAILTAYGATSGRAKDASADGGKGAAGTGLAGVPPSAGLVGGLMRAISPDNEQKQHLDFQRLNDYFDKDAEALAVAARSKPDVASLLSAGGAAEDFMRAGVLRAVKGFVRPSGQPETEARAKSGDRKKTNKRAKRKRNSSSSGHGDAVEEQTAASAEEAIDSEPTTEGRNVTAVASIGDGTAASNVTANVTPQNRVFVVNCRPGPTGLQDEEMDLLSGTVSFLIAKGNNATDEMVVCLESGGGEASAYGLAAAKLARLKDKGFRLTVCVDKVAASGGYMMACVADWLVAAPFAMLGSIGVVGGMPNFNKALRKAGIDYLHFTSGRQKSLVGPFQEVTRANQAMQQRQMDQVHSAFKRHVGRYRPFVDMEAVGTGEVWLGLDAVEYRLADEVGTAMQYLEARMADSIVFLVKPHQPKMVRGSSLLRLLLLGPLAAAGKFAERCRTHLTRASAAANLLEDLRRAGEGQHGSVPNGLEGDAVGSLWEEAIFPRVRARSTETGAWLSASANSGRVHDIRWGRSPGDGSDVREASSRRHRDSASIHPV